MHVTPKLENTMPTTLIKEVVIKLLIYTCGLHPLFIIVLFHHTIDKLINSDVFRCIACWNISGWFRRAYRKWNAFCDYVLQYTLLRISEVEKLQIEQTLSLFKHHQPLNKIDGWKTNNWHTNVYDTQNLMVSYLQLHNCS